MVALRSVLITGGTGVVGPTLVRALVNDGHKVCFSTRELGKAKAMIEKLELNTTLALPIELDFTTENAIENLAELVDGLNFDTIVFNARSLENIKLDSNGELSATQFQSEFYFGVTFPYLALNAMLKAGHPIRDVVFISSMYGVVAPNPALYTDFKHQSPINYGTVKAAQIHLTKEIAVRMSEQFIRCNCISYGGIEGRAPEDFKQRYIGLAPMKDMLTLSDLYPALKFILDNPSLKMTGENIKIDGGWTLW